MRAWRPVLRGFVRTDISAAHARVEPMQAALAAHAALLVAAERRGRVEVVEVLAHRRRRELPGSSGRSSRPSRPDAAREPVGGVVGLLECFLEGGEGSGSRAPGRKHPPARPGSTATRRERASAGTSAPPCGTGQLLWYISSPSACPMLRYSSMRVELRRGIDRADVHVLVERIPTMRLHPSRSFSVIPPQRIPAPAGGSPRSRRGPG